MKRTWVIPGILAAGLTGLGALTYAASAQDGGGRDGGGYSRGDGPRDYGRSGPRWRDDDRRGDDDRGWRRGDDERGPRWRDGEGRGYGPREGRRGDGDDCGPRGRGWGRGEHGWGHHGRGHGMHHGDGPRGGRGFDRRDESDRGYGRGSGHGRHGGFGRGGPGRFDPAQLDSVKKEIGVTAAQEQAWTKYAGAVKEAADSARKRREGMDAGAARGLSPEDFRKFRDLLIEQRRKEQDSVLAAVDELVKSLDEKQVAIAKEVLPGYAFGPGMRGAGMGFGGGRYR